MLQSTVLSLYQENKEVPCVIIIIRHGRCVVAPADKSGVISFAQLVDLAQKRATPHLLSLVCLLNLAITSFLSSEMYIYSAKNRMAHLSLSGIV